MQKYLKTPSVQTKDNEHVTLGPFVDRFYLLFVVWPKNMIITFWQDFVSDRFITVVYKSDISMFTCINPKVLCYYLYISDNMYIGDTKHVYGFGSLTFFFLPTCDYPRWIVHRLLSVHLSLDQKSLENKATDRWSLAWRIFHGPFMSSRSVGTFKIKKNYANQKFFPSCPFQVGR